MFWAILHFAGAAAWIFLATNTVKIDPWAVSVAFVLLAAHSLIAGLERIGR